MINNFEAAYRMLNTGQVPMDIRYPKFQQKLDLFFIDFDWVPLLVQESYLNSMDKRDSMEDIEAMANAAEFISLGDTINRQIRTNMHWGLLP
jgi:replication factor C subunit 1